MFTVGQRVRATMTIYSGYGRAIGKGAEGEVMDSVPSSAKPYSVRFDVLPDLWAVTRYEIEAVATDDAATQPTQEDTMADERKFQVGQRVRAVVDIAHLDIHAGQEGAITDAVGQSVGLYGVMFDNTTRSYSIPASKLEPIAPDAPARVPSRFATCPHGEDPANCSECAPDDVEIDEWIDTRPTATFPARLVLNPSDDQPAASDAPDNDELKQEFCDYCVSQSEREESHLTYQEWLEEKLTQQRIYSRQLVTERDALRADLETAHSEAMHYAALHGAKVAELDEAERENNALLNENMALRAERDEARAEVERLRAALEPFATTAALFPAQRRELDPVIGYTNVGHFRRAAEVYARIASGEGETE